VLKRQQTFEIKFEIRKKLIILNKNDPRRKIVKEVVCLLVSEAGFSSATDESLETSRKN
jgi:hypothetical protein